MRQVYNYLDEGRDGLFFRNVTICNHGVEFRGYFDERVVIIRPVCILD